MCAIVGAICPPGLKDHDYQRFERLLQFVLDKSQERGRDGYGHEVMNDPGSIRRGNVPSFHSSEEVYTIRRQHAFLTGLRFIANFRAEPTTEFVKEKKVSDQQPYRGEHWSIVHNGTIANDKELRTGRHNTDIDSAAILEQLELNSKKLGYDLSDLVFQTTIRSLKGSYAIIAMHAESKGLHVACNYRPIWYVQTEFGIFFASARHYFPEQYSPKMVEPYSLGYFEFGTAPAFKPLLGPRNKRALVVCSGGLDSVVAACIAQRELGLDIKLIHFQYGSRAEGPEVRCIQRVANELGVPLVYFPLNVYSPEDSPLLRSDSTVAGGEAGAEFAHEWVPARNTVMLAVAVAYAEAHGYENIVLGNNLEEAGAYPDNEPEFIARFNDLLPFAVGDGKKLKILQPVGNMMKHEIVKKGLQLNAPLHLTWSCYRAGHLHCGKCGPCYMRRKAFEINNAAEVIEYES